MKFVTRHSISCYLTSLNLSEIRKSLISLSYLLRITPELFIIPLSGSCNLLKKDIFITEHGICSTSTVDAMIPRKKEREREMHLII